MVVIRIWEGLGNQLFQYAYARNLQGRSKNQILLENARVYRKYLPGEDLSVERKCEIFRFNISIPFIQMEKMKKWDYLQQRNKADQFRMKMNCGKYRFVNEGDKMFEYNDENYDFFNYYIMGHFQNIRYLDEIREILLREITLKREMQIPQWLIELLEERQVVSVHVRRGDYLNHKYLLRTIRKIYARNYYDKAITFITERVKQPVILFFSDDMEWVKENLKCDRECYYADELHLNDYEELMLMSKCSHNIMANSTFSFWGAWLNQNSCKFVVGPREMSRSIVSENWVLM